MERITHRADAKNRLILGTAVPGLEELKKDHGGHGQGPGLFQGSPLLQGLPEFLQHADPAISLLRVSRPDRFWK
jgi:hypothetical protein